jgi:hypothetical protein
MAVTDPGHVHVGGALISEEGEAPQFHVCWTAPAGQVFLLPEQAEAAARQLLQAAATARGWQAALDADPNAAKLAGLIAVRPEGRA